MNGNWDVSAAEIVQTGNQQPAMIVCPVKIDSEKYTFNVQAKKLSGTEGFMAMYGYKNPLLSNRNGEYTLTFVQDPDDRWYIDMPWDGSRANDHIV